MIPTVDFKSAKWIWLPKSDFPAFQVAQQTIFAPQTQFCVAVFEKETFTTEDTLLSVKISADVSYIFMLDGKTVSRGPAEVGGDYGRKEGLPWRFFDEFPLPLTKGAHSIKILVISAPRIMADYSSGENGLIVESVNQTGAPVFYTDETWKCYIDRKFVSANFTDFSKGISKKVYAEARKRKHPVPANLKPLVERVISPISVSCENGLYRFDFGKVYSAYLKLRMFAKKRTAIDISMLEIEGLTNRSERMLLVEGENETETLQMHSLRFLEIRAENPVDIHAELVYTHYPVDEETYYSCDDQTLNDIFRVCKRTLKLCMQKYHLDSPVHQEALGCTGDYFIESLINYYTFGVTELSKLDILRTAWLMEETDGKMFHTSYSLIWAQWVLDYYHYTGEPSILSDCEKALNLLLNRFDSYCENGLLENPPDFMFVDWVPVPPFDLHHPPKNLGQSALNCFYYKTLLCGAEIKRLLHKTKEAETLEEKANLLKRVFHQTFWDEERGLYFAGKSDFVRTADFLPVSNEKRYFTVHTNALAVLYGLAGGNGKEIMKKIVFDSTLVPAQPYFMHFVFEALHKEELFGEYAFPLMKPWAEMIRECDSALKEIYLPANVACDYSHAWGGTLAYQLPAKTLGVTFLHGKPNFVTPVLGPLTKAEGVIPLANGSKIKITVEKINGETKRTIQNFE